VFVDIFPIKMKATSSAYATTLQPAIFHKRGDSTPPCGVPLFTSLVCVEVASVSVTILLISILPINPTVCGSTHSSVRDSVIAIGSTLLRRLVCIPWR